MRLVSKFKNMTFYVSGVVAHVFSNTVHTATPPYNLLQFRKVPYPDRSVGILLVFLVPSSDLQPVDE